jgi:Zn-dependent peptidase ImmA (M78 family)
MKAVTLDRILAAFNNATKRAYLHVSANDLESLARKVAFSLYLRKNAFAETMTALPSVSQPLQNVKAVKLAIDLRNLLHVGDVQPLFNLPELMTSKLDILIFTLEKTGIAAACAIIDRTAFVFVPASAEIESLYSCARQLGHLLTAPAHPTSRVFATLESTLRISYPSRSPYERFADFFALELLVPTRALGIALQEIRKLLKVSSSPIGDIELLYLSRIFGVSFLEIGRRCERAQLIPNGGAAALYQFLVDNFGGPEARAKDLELPARPTVQVAPMPWSIVSEIANRIRSGEMSLERASLELGYPTANLNQLLQLLLASN